LVSILSGYTTSGESSYHRALRHARSSVRRRS